MTVETEKEPERSLPDIDFSTFVLSLASSALMYLGEIPEPASGEKVSDLPLAKQTIDIVAMLQAKTKGNLDAAEENLMNSLLYDLRVKYVDAQQKKG